MSRSLWRCGPGGKSLVPRPSAASALTGGRDGRKGTVLVLQHRRRCAVFDWPSRRRLSKVFAEGAAPLGPLFVAWIPSLGTTWGGNNLAQRTLQNAGNTREAGLIYLEAPRTQLRTGAEPSLAEGFGLRTELSKPVVLLRGCTLRQLVSGEGAGTFPY